MEIKERSSIAGLQYEEKARMGKISGMKKITIYICIYRKYNIEYVLEIMG